jgi:hypothetical protein
MPVPITGMIEENAVIKAQNPGSGTPAIRKPINPMVA